MTKTTNSIELSDETLNAILKGDLETSNKFLESVEKEFKDFAKTYNKYDIVQDFDTIKNKIKESIGFCSKKELLILYVYLMTKNNGIDTTLPIIKYMIEELKCDINMFFAVTYCDRTVKTDFIEYMLSKNIDSVHLNNLLYMTFALSAEGGIFSYKNKIDFLISNGAKLSSKHFNSVLKRCVDYPPNDCNMFEVFIVTVHFLSKYFCELCNEENAIYISTHNGGAGSGMPWLHMMLTANPNFENVVNSITKIPAREIGKYRVNLLRESAKKSSIGTTKNIDRMIKYFNGEISEDKYYDKDDKDKEDEDDDYIEEIGKCDDVYKYYAYENDKVVIKEQKIQRPSWFGSNVKEDQKEDDTNKN